MATVTPPADVQLRKAMRQRRSERAKKKIRNQKGSEGKKAARAAVNVNTTVSFRPQ
jgi:hypothetical protein